MSVFEKLQKIQRICEFHEYNCRDCELVEDIEREICPYKYPANWDLHEMFYGDDLDEED